MIAYYYYVCILIMFLVQITFVICLGGGNGKCKGRLSCSPTGVLAKGFKTRDRKKINKLIVVPRGGIKKGASGFGGGK